MKEVLGCLGAFIFGMAITLGVILGQAALQLWLENEGIARKPAFVIALLAALIAVLFLMVISLAREVSQLKKTISEERK